MKPVHKFVSPPKKGDALIPLITRTPQLKKIDNKMNMNRLDLPSLSI